MEKGNMKTGEEKRDEETMKKRRKREQREYKSIKRLGMGGGGEVCVLSHAEPSPLNSIKNSDRRPPILPTHTHTHTHAHMRIHAHTHTHSPSKCQTAPGWIVFK